MEVRGQPGGVCGSWERGTELRLLGSAQARRPHWVMALDLGHYFNDPCVNKLNPLALCHFITSLEKPLSPPQNLLLALSGLTGTKSFHKGYIGIKRNLIPSDSLWNPIFIKSVSKFKSPVLFQILCSSPTRVTPTPLSRKCHYFLLFLSEETILNLSLPHQ